MLRLVKHKANNKLEIPNKMNAAIYYHRDEFEILPTMTIVKTPISLVLMMGWGTVTGEIEFVKKHKN